MSNSLEYEDFYYLFSRWKDAYPYGIPLDEITVSDDESLDGNTTGDNTAGHNSVNTDSISADSQKEEVLQKQSIHSLVSHFPAMFDYQFSLAPSQIVFVSCPDSERLHLGDRDIELLQKVVTSGLKMNIAEDCALLLIGSGGEQEVSGREVSRSADDNSLLSLKDDLVDLASLHWVFLGEVSEEVFSLLSFLKSSHCIKTYSLKEILESDTKKKAFWNQISLLKEI